MITMAVTLKKLCTENGNPCKLSLLAGQNSFRNSVTWVYVLEDESLIRYFHGSELAVTTCMKFPSDPSWLMTLVQALYNRKAAGLVVNVGKFIFEIPAEIIDFCDRYDFPLLIMPWEIHITDMIQSFCTRVILEQQETVLHDNAIRDAILKRGNENEYREILSRYYNLDGKFLVILINTVVNKDGESTKSDETEYRFINHIRRFKTKHNLKGFRVGMISYETYELMILNNMDPDLLPAIRDMVMEVFSEAASSKSIYIGVGIPVDGISQINKSFHRAKTALQMAVYYHEPYIKFEDMGFYKILFSLKDDDLLTTYAGEILGPLEEYEKNHHGYMELLKSYIEHDRSLEKTAEALFLHRNTVNYRIQKIKTILNNPLKTLNDLFPFQVAFAIREMENHTIKHE